MRLGKKKESWLGIVITAVLCLGFLWWFFRPKPQKWEEQGAVILVGKAAAEPPPASRVQRQVLDLDILEVAFSQVRERRKDEALKVASYLSDPVIRGIAARELASGYISADAKDLGEVLEFTAVAPAEQQAAVRADVLGLLAASGFPDAALPEAKTPLQMAVLANRMTDSDDSVRDLVAKVRAALPALPPEEALAVRRELVKAQVSLARQGSPDEAIAAIRELPESARGDLWIELAAFCQGRSDSEELVRRVHAQVEDSAIRRRMEIESLVFGVKLRPAAEIISDCAKDVAAAATPPEKVAALLTLSRAQYDGGTEELKLESSKTLQTALQTAQSITEPVARSRALLRLSRRFANVVLLDDARRTLDLAIAAARAESRPEARVPVLVEAETESYMQSDEPGAVKLMDEAVADLGKAAGVADHATVESLASALVRRGHWERGLALVDTVTPDADRVSVLEQVIKTAVEQFAGVDPANPPPRGEPFDGIRQQAIRNQVAAANLTEAQPEGYARARGWLAMAKAVFTPPMSLTDYMGAGATEGPAAEESPATGPEPTEPEAPQPEKKEP